MSEPHEETSISQPRRKGGCCGNSASNDLMEVQSSSNPNSQRNSILIRMSNPIHTN